MSQTDANTILKLLHSRVVHAGLLIFAALFIVVFVLAPTPSTEIRQVDITLANDTVVRAYIADSPKEREEGLGPFDYLPQGQGMLFVFEQETIPVFWMKDVEYPLDIVWLHNGSVVGTEEGLSPDERDERPTYSPTVPVTHVLEVHAGVVEQEGIKIGQRLEFGPGLDEKGSF